jgi:hypothetical protein
LDLLDRHSALKQGRCDRMAQQVRIDALLDLRFLRYFLDDLLYAARRILLFLSGRSSPVEHILRRTMRILSRIAAPRASIALCRPKAIAPLMVVTDNRTVTCSSFSLVIGKSPG